MYFLVLPSKTEFSPLFGFFHRPSEGSIGSHLLVSLRLLLGLQHKTTKQMSEISEIINRQVKENYLLRQVAVFGKHRARTLKRSRDSARLSLLAWLSSLIGV